MITQRQRRPEDAEQPAAQAAVGGQCLIELSPLVTKCLGQSDDRGEGGVSVRRARQRPQHIDVFFGVPAELRQVGARAVVDQPEAAQAGDLRPFRYWLVHVFDGSADVFCSGCVLNTGADQSEM